MSVTWYIIVLGVIAATIGYVAFNFFRIRKMPEGTKEMAEMAGIIRSGANTFMKTEYRTIIIQRGICGRPADRCNHCCDSPRLVHGQLRRCVR